MLSSLITVLEEDLHNVSLADFPEEALGKLSPIVTSWTSSSCWSGVSPSSPAWSLTPPSCPAHVWRFVSFIPWQMNLSLWPLTWSSKQMELKVFYVDWLLCLDPIVPQSSSGNNCSIPLTPAILYRLGSSSKNKSEACV